MKKQFLGVVVTGLLFSCGEPKEQKTEKPQVANADTIADSTVTATDSFVTGDGEYSIYYVTIADTSSNYHLLDGKMYELSKTMNKKIDTMNRHYDAKKNDIVLADDDEDEMYRGEYFPRRYPSEDLSLEYLEVYTEYPTNAIALVAGIYEEQKAADSTLTLLKPHATKAFVLKSRVYVGCMH